MTAITATVSASPIGRIANPLVTAQMGAYLADYWPIHAATPRALVAGTLARIMAAAPHRAVTGLRAHGYRDDYYSRVHARPLRLDLGNLVNDQVRDIEVWNAWLDRSQTLTAVVATDAAGVVLTPPGSLPITFAPLQSLHWTVTVSLLGPPALAAREQWQFADATQNVMVVIDGLRVTAWAWPPDWSTSVIERLSWLTSIATSLTGAEQRRACRLSPRATFEFAAIAANTARSALDLALYDAGGRLWALPIWHDVERLSAPLAPGATAIPSALGRDYHDGGLAMLIGDDPLIAEMVEIAHVDPVAGALVLRQPVRGAWPVGTRLYPARTARFAQQPQPARQTDTLWAVQVQFALAESYDATPAPPATTYRGAPVIEAVPEESNPLAYGFERVTQTIDNQTGIPSVTDSAVIGFPLQAYGAVCASRVAANALRGLLYALRGRQQAFWLPTFAADLQLAIATPAVGITLTIARCGYSRHASLRVGRRDLRIDVPGRPPIYRRIVACSETGSTEALTLDNAPGVALTPGVGRISFMALCRLNSDDIEIEHVTDADGLTQCTLPLRGVRDDLELA
ncbi:MAG: hypothetical protein JSR26_03865 [Proteobacteria bacterium]|nr:hypothetical protein [Pseudomonadota bacterium]